MRLLKLLKTFRITSPTVLTRNYSEYKPKPLRSLKPKSTRSTVQYFVDAHRVRAVAGNGGDGCISFLSAWCKDHAGPDGGDGGNGGHVIFQASHSVKSLNHCRSVVQAKHGERGFNKDCTGKNATHIVVPVPLGTIIRDLTGRVIGDLSAEGVMFVAARGGAGGRGNKFFLTDTDQAPEVAELGAVGEANSYLLEVRSMSHVGLVGAPNAGKSSLLRATTRARPKAADYPFTTTQPHIGMVLYDDYEQVAIADLPGLIEGSHRNRGLGIQFLQHVERCRGLIFLLDGTHDPETQLKTLKHELHQYNPNLLNRKSCIVVNKIDLPEAMENYERIKEKFETLNTEKHRLHLNETQETPSEHKLHLNKTQQDSSEHRFHKNLESNNERLKKLQENTDHKLHQDEENLKPRENTEHSLHLSNSELNTEKMNETQENTLEHEIHFEVLGISAKTGQNLHKLLSVVRQMYDSGEK